MKQELIELKSEDGLYLKGILWLGIENPVSTVLLIHGLGEYGGRYEHVANKFIDEGFNVVAYDQRGHGKSDGKRGHTPSQDHLLNDLELFISYCTEKLKQPLVLYGHSFGGNVLCTYLLKRDTSKIKAAIISSAWLRLAFEPPSFKMALAKIMNFLWPSFTQKNDIDSADLTYVDELNRKYVTDKLVHSKISASLFLNAFNSAKWCLDNAKKLKTDSLIIHGQDDPIVSLDGSKKLHQDSTCSEIKIWSETKHEPHNDQRNKEVISFVISWIKNKI